MVYDRQSGENHVNERTSVTTSTPPAPADINARPPRYVDVLVVGAGVSGISMACHLTQRHPQRTFAVLEARSDLGGTWDQFRYPGIRSDSDLQTFGYRFKPWTGVKSLAPGDMILDYVREASSEHGVDDHIWTHHAVESADWSTADLTWNVHVRNTATDDVFTIQTRWLATASGMFSYDSAYIPDFPGRDEFAGTFLHPQFWPEDLDVRDKEMIIIGSGATAVTILPAVAAEVAHVTMLQRSPGYILPWPDVDPIANGLRRVFGNSAGHAAARWKNIRIYTGLYRFSQRFPRVVRRAIRMMQKRRLPADFDFETHLTPRYNPWDQRMCLVPNGDFFSAISSGKASIVTDRIDRITPNGIRLQSGNELSADIIVSATGFDMKPLGGITLSVDGVAMPLGERISFRGMMLSDVPNFSYVIGYTTNSWTLKSDLVAEHVTRMLTMLDEEDAVACVPRPPADLETQQFAPNFRPGYVERSAHLFPQQGTKAPWLSPVIYDEDVREMRRTPVASRDLEVIRPGATDSAATAGRTAGAH